MKLTDLTNHAGEWLRGSGPMSEIVISSRIRLARNVAGYRFLCPLHAPPAAGARSTQVRETILDAGIAPQTLVRRSRAGPGDRPRSCWSSGT